MATILGIESTCDETAAAVVADGWLVRSNVVATQVELHAKYRGVVPEIASRAHIENILPVLAVAATPASPHADDVIDERMTQLLADYADVLAMTQGRRLQGEPEALVARALAADPNHVKALALAGSAAFERGEYRAAIRHWQLLLTRVPANVDFARSIRGGIAQAEERLKLAPLASPIVP